MYKRQANVEDIRKYTDLYNIAGVTTNPTILSRENREFFPLLHEIKNIIGNKELHVQVTADTWDDMVKEAETIVKAVDKQVYIKVPSNEQGMRTMKELKEREIHVTATAIYTPQQAMLAAVAGADYVAPYFNRMNNLNVDSKKAIGEIAWLYEKYHCRTEILAASFKNTQQVMDALLAGSHAVTVPVELLTQMVTSPVIESAVAGFKNDWIKTYGEKKIYELSLIHI